MAMARTIWAGWRVLRVSIGPIRAIKLGLTSSNCGNRWERQTHHPCRRGGRTRIPSPQTLENHIDFVTSALISPDFCYTALTTETNLGSRNLHVYSTSSGKLLAFGATEGSMLWFAPGGRGIYCAVNESKVEEITIIQGNSDHPTPATAVVEHQSGGRPWGSSRS